MGLATAAHAATPTNLVQRAGVDGCVTESGNSGQCQDGRGLIGATSIALSPDGQNAYVASKTWSSISILTRDDEDGALTPVSTAGGCFYAFEGGYSDCTKVRAIGKADDVAVSHDGKSVYVASYSEDAIAVFKRDLLTGALTLSAGLDGCASLFGFHECATGRGIEHPTGVVVSPDDKNVYVSAAGQKGGVATFQRNTTTGELTQKAGGEGCISPIVFNSCAKGLDQLLDAQGIQVSPDGKNVYVASAFLGALTIYDRGAEGVLTPQAGLAACIDEEGDPGCRDGAGLEKATGVAVSSDGGTVYVASAGSDGIAIFDRDATSGALTQKPGVAGCVTETGATNPSQLPGACADGAALDGANAIGILPDGSALYASAEESSGIAIFERHADGTLAQRPATAGCLTETGYENTSVTAGYCEDGTALQGASGVITSADGKYVYSAAPAVEGGIGVFDVVPAPPEEVPPTPPPPAEPGPEPESASCLAARASLRRDEARAKAAAQASHLEVLRARRAGDASKRRSHLEAARRHRRKMKGWLTAAKRAARRVDSLC